MHVKGCHSDLSVLMLLAWQVPPHCIPIHANVTTYDWRPLIASTQFDVVMMDPPWQLATANPTRGGLLPHYPEVVLPGFMVTAASHGKHCSGHVLVSFVCQCAGCLLG